IRDRNVTGVQTCALPISSVKKFLGIGNRNPLGKEIIAHTFSANFKTIFIHFPEKTAEEHLHKIAKTFNEKQTQREDIQVDVKEKIGRASCRERVKIKKKK